jgi:O-antigen biosynthesis protein
LNINSFHIKINDSGFDDFIKKLNPTIVIFDRFITEEQFGWRVAINCPNTLRILDTIDLHFLRKERQEKLKHNLEISDNDLLNSDLAKREIASIYRCDLSLIISQFEMDLLINVFKIDSKILYYLPFLLHKMPVKILETFPTFAERRHFISIGNFKHEPNWDAVLYLKNNIWKKIKNQLPDAELHIYGSYISEKAMQFDNVKEGFIIKGRAENAHEVVKNARVLLAPLRFGAGLKGKLIDAMQAGTPSVTTSIGAEGMTQPAAIWNGVVTDDESVFANAAVALYSEENLWKNAQRNGIEIIKNCYDKTVLGPIFLNKITTLQIDLQQHRTNNFIGKMLQHHTMQSTKYMSRWIETKNSK